VGWRVRACAGSLSARSRQGRRGEFIFFKEGLALFKVGDLRIFLMALCLLAVGCSSSSKSSVVGVSTSTVQFVAPATSPTIELGQSVTFTVTAPGGVTWTLQNGSGFGQPQGQLSNETSTAATYTAPPSTNPPQCNGQSPPPAPQQAVVTATSVSDPTQSASITVIVAQAGPCVATLPMVTTYTAGGIQNFSTCPPAGTVIPYTPSNNPQLFQVGAFNQVKIFDGGGNITPFPSPFGVGPFTWGVTGSLPNGISLVPGPDSSEVAIGGTPVSPGCSVFTIQITDATGVSANVPFFIAVLPPALKTQVPDLPNAYVNTSTNAGIPYSPQALVTSGGIPPYVWAYNLNPVGPPNFPVGLCLISAPSSVPAGCTTTPPPANSSIGVISGTPTSADLMFGLPTPYSVQLQVNDSQAPYPAVALINSTITADIAQPFCTAAPPLQPVPGLNGGTITGGQVPGNSYLQGSLAFLLRGFDANGPVVMAGSVNLSSDGSGSITGGVMDVTRSGGSQNLTIVPAGSSYTVGVVESTQLSYNRGCMTLANSAGTKTTFAFTLGGCSNDYSESGVTTLADNACGMMQNGQQQNIPAGFFTAGRVIEFDDTTSQGTRATGILRTQNSSTFAAGLSGPYAFGFSGGSPSGHFAMAGSFQSGAGNLSSVAADLDNAGSLSSQVTGGSGTYSIGANGRGTGSLTLGQSNFDLALYMVDNGEVIAISTDPLSAAHPVIGGEALTTSSVFSNASLQNSHMFHIGGLLPNCAILPAGCPDVSVGVLSFDGIGTVSGTVSEDQAGTLGSASISGVYSVDTATGRTTFSAPETGQSMGPHTFVAYIIPVSPDLTTAACSNPASCITGFLVGTDGTAQDGVLEFQTSVVAPPPPFASGFVVGDFVYGTDESLASPATNLEGTVNASPSSTSVSAGSFGSQLQDSSSGDPNYCSQSGCLLLLPNQFVTGSYSVNSNGTGSFGGGTVSVTNGKVVFYIDESPLDLYPAIIVAEQ
jgi:hypothetical protein